MERFVLIAFCMLLPNLLSGQVKNIDRNEIYSYDYCVTIDCEELLYSNDYKIIINPTSDRNSLLYVTYEYVSDSLAEEENSIPARVPIDTNKYELSKIQLEAIYELTEKLFVIPELPEKYFPTIYEAPMIYDGPNTTIIFEFKGYVFTSYLFPDSEIVLDYNRLLDLLEQIKTGL